MSDERDAADRLADATDRDRDAFAAADMPLPALAELKPVPDGGTVDTCDDCGSADTRAYYEGPEFGDATLYACRECRHTWVVE